MQVTSSAGRFSVTTNLWGFANLPARGDATLKVEKEGFRAVTQSLDVSRDQNIRIVLQSSNAAGLTASREEVGLESEVGGGPRTAGRSGERRAARRARGGGLAARREPQRPPRSPAATSRAS